MLDESIAREYAALQDEAAKIHDQAQAYQRKLMAPVFKKRRELTKSIPGFWAQAFGNSPFFGRNPSENDIEALGNLTDFYVEYDDERPNYRKVTATFEKNDVFKNEVLTKEFIIGSDDEDGTVITKTTIDYHDKKTPSRKRKADEDDEDDDDDDDDYALSFIDWFSNDDIDAGVLVSDDLYPNALEYFQGLGQFEDSSDEDKIVELGSEDDSEEEDEEPKKKKSKK